MPHPTKTRKQRRNKEEDTYTPDNIQRHPRPLGLTYANLNLQKQEETNRKELENKLKESCIQLYIRDGFNWMGKIVTINQFARYLNINTQELLLKANRELERIALFFEGKESKALARGLTIKALQESLEILALTKGQASLLLAQQGNKYVPFLSGEANRALANLIGAQKPLLEVLNKFTDKQPTNILINNNGTSSTSGTDYITPEMALQMIHNQGTSMYNNPALIKEKEAELGELTDVNARNQDLSKIGIKIPNKLIDREGNDLKKYARNDTNLAENGTLKAEDFLPKT